LPAPTTDADPRQAAPSQCTGNQDPPCNSRRPAQQADPRGTVRLVVRWPDPTLPRFARSPPPKRGVSETSWQVADGHARALGTGTGTGTGTRHRHISPGPPTRRCLPRSPGPYEDEDPREPELADKRTLSDAPGAKVTTAYRGLAFNCHMATPPLCSTLSFVGFHRTC